MNFILDRNLAVHDPKEESLFIKDSSESDSTPLGELQTGSPC